uniref:Uncharacterized protein n=1 Tax=Arundo donax TaxID=35708 RepID=A0A0A8ZJM6_ARUDO
MDRSGGPVEHDGLLGVHPRLGFDQAVGGEANSQE